MKALVVGLGSMGKRRVRNLLHLNTIQVAGFDVREDRRNESFIKYGIQTFDNFATACNLHQPDVLIISTPPDLHMQYAYAALDMGIHCFIEASVVHADKIKELYALSKARNILMAPSCTMRYFSGPKTIKSMLNEGLIGKVIAWNYHTGQRLEEWHPWESISDFYVSKRETGGAREIVPFELTWLNDLFGEPKVLSGFKSKVSNMSADIDDIYQFTFLYPEKVFATMTVEVISRIKAARYLRIIGEKGQIIFDGDENSVRYVNDQQTEWKITKFNQGTIEKQYINPEEPYINEMKDFITAVESGDFSHFPNTLLEDWKILELLNQVERRALAWA